MVREEADWMFRRWRMSGGWQGHRLDPGWGDSPPVVLACIRASVEMGQGWPWEAG